MTSVLIKWGNLDTEPDRYTGRMPCDHEGRDQGDVSSSQRTPEIASRPPEARRKGWKRFSFPYFKRNPSADTLRWNF